MIIPKRLITQYDTSETLVMISLYPKKGERYSTGVSGLASYAKNVITPMNHLTIVLADYDKKPAIYKEGKTLVVRCFQTNSPFMWLDIFRTLIQFSHAKNVLIQHDFSVYGSMIVSALIVPFLTILRLFGFTISIVLHHVVTDIFKLAGHVGLKNTFFDRMRGHVYNILFKGFYTLVGVVSTNIVVLEESLKTRLSSVILKQKITTIPHGVDTSLTTIPKKNARTVLGIKKDDYVIMFFGFVNWFKGADFFADTFSDKSHILGKKIHGIIAGGESSTMKGRTYYQTFYNSVAKTVCSSPTLSMTGYILQEDIQTYFSAADLVVFPYRNCMTASGVLSLTFSYGKPFIISQPLDEMFEAQDFKKNMKELGLSIGDLTFDLKKESCLACTENILKNGLRDKMRNLSIQMRETRDYAKTAKEYQKLLSAPKHRWVVTPNPKLAKLYSAIGMLF